MLPYLEQTAIYNATNFNLLSQGDLSSYQGYVANITSIVAKVSVFICPSAPQFPGTLYGFQSPGNNYFASVGSSVNWDGTQTNKPNGPFYYSGPTISSKDVSDGTSNTIAFSEWRTGDNNGGILTVPQDIIEIGTTYLGGSRNNPQVNMPAGASVLPAWLANCASKATTAANRSGIAQLWATGMFGRTFGNTLLAPNPPYPNCNNVDGNGDLDNTGNFGMSSYHSGGANASFCDGSVRFIKSSTALQTIWALGSRNQGEVISADSY